MVVLATVRVKLSGGLSETDIQYCTSTETERARGAARRRPRGFARVGMPAPCRRHYNATALTSASTRQHELALLADQGAGRRSCHGPRHARLCNAAVTDDLGISRALPSYSDAQRHAFLERFEGIPVRRAHVRPTPWLSLRKPLEDSMWRLPSWLWSRERRDVATASAATAYFYGNEYTDLSLFTHFFSQPTPVLGGTYIEIGGSNGVHASNTLFFEQHLNWSGVLIEPTPCGRCILPHTRPRDLTINAGACVSSGNLTFDSMAASFCPAPQDSCVAHSKGGYRAYSVPCKPMNELLPHTLTHVDLLSVDVEDRVMQVLRTMPWERTAVDVVLAECPGSALLKACSRLLRHHGFRTLPISLGGDVLAVREECLR